MTNVVIIEDDPNCFKYLNELLALNYSDKINVVGQASSVDSAIQLIKLTEPQLVFLDIQLNGGTGFDILDHFSESSNFEVIFTTGLIDYKEKAMDYFAFYYLNKPIQKEQLSVVLNKFFKKQSAFDLEKYLVFKNQLENKHTKISLPITNGGYVILNIDEILYCKADGSYTNFISTKGKNYITSTNLKNAETMLEKATFFRIHRSILVNLKHIVEFHNSGEIQLSNGQQLTVSSRNKKNFLKVLKFMSYNFN